jgi:FAD/FMN-containing dehydrogenase
VNDKKEKLMGIVGAANVLDDPGTLEAYSRDESFVRPMKPWFVVKPKNAAEVQEIVKCANETQTPLVPVSSGPPRFYGDTVPSTPGAVIVDLSGMKRIIKIDRRNRLTVIEPGLTYGELQPELAKEGLTLPNPLLPKASKSVVTSMLERQPVLIPKYQFGILDPLRCVEVVWGNGDRFLTGDAGNLGSLDEAWERKHPPVSPSGPGQVDFYRLVSAAQGSMGIVTWAVLKCQVLPELRKLFFVPARRLEDLKNFAYRVLRLRFGDENLILNSANLASILGEGADGIKALQGKLPPWVFLIGVAGREILPRERIEFQEKDLREMAQQFGLQLLSAVPGAREGEVMDALVNPSSEPYWKLRYKGGCQDILFVTTLEKAPEFVKTVYSLAEAMNCSPSDIGVYIQPVHQGASCHCEFNIPFNPDNKQEVARIKEFFTRASEELQRQGAFFSRPYGIWASMAFNRDAQSTMVLKKLKGIFDPNNVMNPGKLCF